MKESLKNSKICGFYANGYFFMRAVIIYGTKKDGFILKPLEDKAA